MQDPERAPGELAGSWRATNSDLIALRRSGLDFRGAGLSGGVAHEQLQIADASCVKQDVHRPHTRTCVRYAVVVGPMPARQ